MNEVQREIVAVACARDAPGSEMSPDDKQYPDHSVELRSLVGQSLGPPEVARDPVNRSMIRHWVEAMGDANPVYRSDEEARSVGLPGVVAPPTMLQAWGMRGLTATLALEIERAAGGPAGDDQNTQARMMLLLDDEGCTSVVATNCEQQYVRPLRLGERLVSSSVVEAISDVKATALGVGRFVTTRQDFVSLDGEGFAALGDDVDPEALMSAGEPVATMRFRILKFRPGTAAPADAALARPRPALTQDNAFFFEGTREHKLLIQRCTSCGTLRHPPLPACAKCRSFEWDTVEASGRGTLYILRGRALPAGAGVRLPPAHRLGRARGRHPARGRRRRLAPEELRIGMPLVAGFVDFDEELSLPVFRPADDPGKSGA